MKDLLLSAAIGDICGVPYEFDHPTKNYDDVDLLHPEGDYSDDTVCTFAIAEAFLHNLDVSENLWKRCRQHPHRGYGGRFRRWLMTDERLPYNSLGNGSSMRCSSAAFLAHTVEECEELATRSAMPTHNHDEGVKGAVATALAIFHLLHGKDKEFIRTEVLAKYYPEWQNKTYSDFHDTLPFDETCPSPCHLPSSVSLKVRTTKTVSNWPLRWVAMPTRWPASPVLWPTPITRRCHNRSSTEPSPSCPNGCSTSTRR